MALIVMRINKKNCEMNAARCALLAVPPVVLIGLIVMYHLSINPNQLNRFVEDIQDPPVQQDTTDDERECRNNDTECIDKLLQRSGYHFEDFTFDSDFETGNLKHVQLVNSTWYKLTIAQDLEGTPYQQDHYASYFRFKVSRMSRSINTIVITLMNFGSNQQRNVEHGWVPVYKTNSSNGWAAMSSPITNMTDAKDKLEITFSFTFNSSDLSVDISSGYPYSYSQKEDMLSTLEQRIRLTQGLYYQRDTIAWSLEGRSIDLLTLTYRSLTSGVEDYNSSYFEGLFPCIRTDQCAEHSHPPPPRFEGKKVVVFATRIHPAEAPASYMLEGLLNQLLSSKMRNILRDAVVLVIPMMNPDGVANGFYRSDMRGRDLNRCYLEEDDQGPIANRALRKLLGYYNQTGRLKMFVDLHTHSLFDGLFVYGNLGDVEAENTEVQALMERMEARCEHFMRNNSKNDLYDSGKAAIGRYFFRKYLGIKHIYTIESSYFRGNPEKAKPDGSGQPKRLETQDFRDMGSCILESIEDIWPLIRDQPSHFSNQPPS